MTDTPKIGLKNPAAVLRDVSEDISKFKTLVVVGIYEDDSASVWASETPDEIERASLVLLRFATEMQGSLYE